MSKIALLVGIDDYPPNVGPLNGCVKDATRLGTLLSTDHDPNSKNFQCKVMASSIERVTRSALKKTAEQLFSQPADVALFFFAGHGTVKNLGGYLVTQDATCYDEGVSMAEVLTLANNSPALERIIILDCCHAGAFGAVPAIDNDMAVLREGVTVLTASRKSEEALELVGGGGGLFTSLVCDALAGGAADVLGKVTMASIYAFVDEVLGWEDQRPLLKSHVSKLVCLRTCHPAVAREKLRLLTAYFPTPSYELPLDPTYEPLAGPEHAHPEHEAVFGNLQRFTAARLVMPVGEQHMYFAAMNGKSCKLTALGSFYWHLAKNAKI